MMARSTREKILKMLIRDHEEQAAFHSRQALKLRREMDGIKAQRKQQRQQNVARGKDE